MPYFVAGAVTRSLGAGLSRGELADVVGFAAAELEGAGEASADAGSTGDASVIADGGCGL